MRQVSVATIIVLFAIPFALHAKASDQQCDAQSTEIPIATKQYEGVTVRVCKFPDGFRVLNGAGEQIYIENGKDGTSRVCVKNAAPRAVKGRPAPSASAAKLCCPQVNTTGKVQVPNSLYQSAKGSRFECEKDKEGKELNSLKVSRVDEKGNFVQGTDSFTISGSLDEEKTDGKPNKDRKSKIYVKQVRASGSLEGQIDLQTDVGKGGSTGDDTCDSSRKCKVQDLLAEKDTRISLDDETKKYMNKGKAIQSNRNGEQKHSADAGTSGP